MTFKVPEEPPQGSGGDFSYVLGKAMVSAIPIVGGPAVELLAAIMGPPIERRREEWISNIADAVNELNEKVASLTPEALSENEGFISVAIRASQMAMRNHQQEKLDALRNAVQNSALPNAPEDDLKMIFLDNVDALTPWHLRLLKMFSNPVQWFGENDRAWPNLMMGGVGSIIEAAYPELVGRRDFYDLLGRELYSRGLTNTEGFHTTISEHGLKERRLSQHGAEFLKFIEKQV
jgi:hypothetical protein